MKKSKFLPTLLLAGAAMFGTNSAMAISLDFVAGSSASDVDVVVSGLSAANEIVSAFDLDIAYDSGANTAMSVDFSQSEAVMGGFFDFLAFDTLSAGLVNLFAFSFLFDADLDLLQGDEVTLATISFDSAVDLASLSFDFSGPQNVVGKNFQALSFDAVAVPVPGTALLMLLGLVGLLVSGSNRKRASSTSVAAA